jgi:hypothetical protein
VQMTIIRTRSGDRDYTAPRLTPSGKDKTMPELQALTSAPDGAR